MRSTNETSLGRAQRLSSLWSWLPAFRAVAETEHLPSASRAVHLTPSALSRTIRLLEEDVGRPLFDRVGRSLELNAAGHAFLSSVRDAMRLVDGGLAAISNDELIGSVRVSVPGPFAPLLVLPAVAALLEEHPRLEPFVGGHPDAALPGLLLRGALDVALTDEPRPSPDLHMEPLMRVTHGVYWSPDHPLASHGRPKREDVLAQTFAAPPLDERGQPIDPWPPHLQRRIGLRVTQMQVAVDSCVRGDTLSALPDVVARRAGLLRVPFEELPSTTLYLVHRRSLPIRGKAEVVAEAIRAVVAAT